MCVWGQRVGESRDRDKNSESSAKTTEKEEGEKERTDGLCFLSSFFLTSLGLVIYSRVVIDVDW